MLHHISLPVVDLARSKRLYDAALEMLGYHCVFETPTAVGYGIDAGKDKLCLKQVNSASAAGIGFHLALLAPSVQAVERFHQAAIEQGATDNGAPGWREEYGPGYYAAYVIDIDHHRLEAVFKEA